MYDAVEGGGLSVAAVAEPRAPAELPPPKPALAGGDGTRGLVVRAEAAAWPTLERDLLVLEAALVLALLVLEPDLLVLVPVLLVLLVLVPALLVLEPVLLVLEPDLVPAVEVDLSALAPATVEALPVWGGVMIVSPSAIVASRVVAEASDGAGPGAGGVVLGVALALRRRFAALAPAALLLAAALPTEARRWVTDSVGVADAGRVRLTPRSELEAVADAAPGLRVPVGGRGATDTADGTRDADAAAEGESPRFRPVSEQITAGAALI